MSLPIITVVLGLLLLIFLVTYIKLNTFISFMIVGLFIGLVMGLPMAKITKAMQDGIGETMGNLLIVIVLGSMLGKLVAESGAAQRIADGILDIFGPRYVQWALMLTGLVVGIPLFYGIGFILMVPLIFTVAARTKLPAVFLGIPMLASLSVTHGFLPPHPAPTTLVLKFGANMGLTLLYGLLLAIPAIVLAGPVFAMFLKKYNREPAKIFDIKPIERSALPGMFTSISVALLPVVLLATTALIKVIAKAGTFAFKFAEWFGEPVIVMLITVIVAIIFLGLRRGSPMKEVMGKLEDAVKDISGILLVIAGSGILTQLLKTSGISDKIAGGLLDLHASPLLVAWTIAAIIRVCIGSATIAGFTAAGIVMPMLVTTPVNPCLMVLATGAGSLMFSHVNDSGFWLFKEYFNLTIKETIMTWSIMETIVSVVGLGGVLLMGIWL